MHATTTSSYFPISLRMNGVKILIVGGGLIAARKIRFLLEKQAIIEVFANDLCAGIKQWKQENRLKFLGPLPDESRLKDHMRQCRLVFAATDDHTKNAEIAEWANSCNILVCAIDDPHASNFITPAIIDRDPVQIAVSTGGTAPVLARRLRETIEGLFNHTTGKIALFMGKYRSMVRNACPDLKQRQRLWENFLDGPGGAALHQGYEKKALDHLQLLLDYQKPLQGEVYLIGAGPGDPDLLTLKALHYLQNADTILYDRLLSPEILQRARRDANLIFVGKQKSQHRFSQDEINHLLIEHAQKGERVVRLKGGDPLIFGRGGEEIEALAKAQIPFQIIPGVTAANGCAAYANIPLTHRDCAQSCIFITGHAKKDGTLDLPWKSVIRPNQTVVIYMGLESLSYLCKRLIQEGLPPNWPAAIVENGTLPEQRVIAGTLANLPEKVLQAGLKSPALTFIGEVVLHRKIST